MAILFSCTLFISALLLFWVQPLIAKIILPKFGGSPAVWNTCMVFFQTLLLGGYLYAHGSTSRLPVKWQVRCHGALLALAFLVLPFSVRADWAPPADVNPIPSLLGLLCLTVGVPFFVLSASAPLLQKWFVLTGHPSGKDPYFLYAASNVGSALALLSYPTLLEPGLVVPVQSVAWTTGYLGLVLLMIGCGYVTSRHGASYHVEAKPETADSQHEPAAPGRGLKLYWVSLAFAPSSLMLGVTTLFSTDIAPVPLIWVIPLALYLFSFILVFSRLPKVVHFSFVVVYPLLVLALLLIMWVDHGMRTRMLILWHLAVFFCAAMVCHGELARTRPGAAHLTSFYAWMSVGGMLGGVFNALVAPLLFHSVIEYIVVLVLTCFLCPDPISAWRTYRSRPCPRGHTSQVVGVLLDLLLPLAVGLLAWRLAYITMDPKEKDGTLFDLYQMLSELDFIQQMRFSGFLNVLHWSIPLFLCCFLVNRRWRFGLGVALVVVVHAVNPAAQAADCIHRDRSFFAIHRILRWQTYNLFMHGTTLHGAQNVDYRGLPVANPGPMSYFHPDNPIGQVFQALKRRHPAPPVAVLGLGVGTLASYAQADQVFDFYEIDPAVVRIARDDRFFTYLRDCRTTPNIILGDGRLKIADARDDHYGVIVADAFSSDAVPVHLINQQAVQLYLGKLTGDGILVFNISNRHLDLVPVLANIAKAENLVGYYQHDPIENYPLRTYSSWVILARNDEAFADLRTPEYWKPRVDASAALGYWMTPLSALALRDRDYERALWQPLPPSARVGLWTDDFSSLFGVFKWND